MLGNRCLTPSKLLMQREKQVGLLKVAISKLQTARMRMRRRDSQATELHHGPKGLYTTPNTIPKAMEEQAGAIANFWQDVWGKEGPYRPNHDAITAWVTETKARTRSATEEKTRRSHGERRPGR